MIGAVNPVRANNNSQMTFQGVKEGYQFRRAANKMIHNLKNVEMGSRKYYEPEVKNQQSLKVRLHNLIYKKAKAIGRKHVTQEDRRLHEKLKNLYKKRQMAELNLPDLNIYCWI